MYILIMEGNTNHGNTGHWMWTQCLVLNRCLRNSGWLAGWMDRQMEAVLLEDQNAKLSDYLGCC